MSFSYVTFIGVYKGFVNCFFVFQDLEPAPDVEFNVEETSVVSKAPEVSV